MELSVALQPDDANFGAKEAYLKVTSFLIWQPPSFYGNLHPQAMGLQSRMSFPLLIDRMSSELVEYLRLCCLTPSDLGDRALNDFEYNQPISVDNEARVSVGVRVRVRVQPADLGG